MDQYDHVDEADIPQQAKKLNMRPARKQVKPGQVTKNEVVQTGKEYSTQYNGALEDVIVANVDMIDIWYNKWAGGDREDSYSK